MTPYIILASVLALVALVAAYQFWYAPRYVPLQKWVESTPLGWGPAITTPGQIDRDPAWLWFRDNDWGMGRRGTLKLTTATKTLLDRTLKAKRWKQYITDAAGIDWEPLTQAHRAGSGDCEDAARVFAEALIAAGIDPACLSYYFVALPRAGDHVLLAVDTDKGTYCADHTTSRFHPWSDYPRIDSEFPRRISPDGIYYATEK